MKDDIEKIAHLARLDSTDPQLTTSMSDLEKILVYFQVIHDFLDLETVTGFVPAYPLPAKSCSPESDDDVRDRIITGFPATRDGEIEIPSVLDGAGEC